MQGVAGDHSRAAGMIARHLGLLAYRDAWALQERIHEEILAGGEEQVLLVEHPPVITFGRRPGGEKNLVASRERLARLGVELVDSDRGGDVTFHGPGQLVAYPIVRLTDHRLSVGAYVQRLEDVVIATLASFGVVGEKDPSAIGIWAADGGTRAKICALGVRIRRGVSLHGVALNVETDLRYFNLIVPCGLATRPVTSMRKLMGDATPSMEAVQLAFTRHAIAFFSGSVEGTRGRD
jgi:lipoate-protein ligase B